MENIFYSVVSEHCNESVESIINRKKTEIEKVGYSLWAALIDKKSIDQVWNLSSTDKVYVLCSINSKSKISKNQKDVSVAKYYECPEGKFKIVEDIVTTYPSKRNERYFNPYQAYFVNNYTILSKEKEINIGQYETLLANGQTKNFEERFIKCTRFCDTYGKLNANSNAKANKKIGLIMELKYPFVVQLKVH